MLVGFSVVIRVQATPPCAGLRMTKFSSSAEVTVGNDDDVVT